MSFEYLMKHANDIQAKAIRNAQNEIATGHQRPPEYANGIETYYADIPDLFEPFSTMPDPGDYEYMAKNIDGAMGTICTSSSTTQDPYSKTGITYRANPEMSLGGVNMSDWNGKAANQFKEKFIGRFYFYSENQFITLAAVRAGLAAHQAMWQEARKNIDAIAHAVEHALDVEGTWGAVDKNKWNVTFTVLASVATVAALEAPEFATLLTVIGAYAQAKAVLSDDQPDTVPYSGENALAITNAMKAAMKRLDNDIEATKNKMSTGLTELRDDIAHNRDAQLLAARPTLAGKSGSELRDGLGPPQ